MKTAAAASPEHPLRQDGPGAFILIGLLSFGHLAADVVQGALPALLPYLKDRYALGYAATGSVLLAAHISSSILQPLFGYVTDRRPLPLLLPMGLIVSGAGMALLPFAPNLKVLLALVLLLGLGTAAYHPEGFKAAGCLAGARRATGMSFFSFGGNLGFAIGGPLAIYLVSHLGMPGACALFAPCIVASALLLPALPRIRQRVATGNATRQGGRAVHRPHRAIVLIVLIVVMRTWTQLGLAAFLPFLYRVELDRNPEYVATLLFLLLGSGTVGTLVGGPIGDRIGHRRTLFASLVLQVPLIAWFLLAKGWLVFALACLIGATIVSTFSVTIVMPQELFPSSMATASGMVAGFAIGTGGLGVTLLGAVADRWGLTTTLHVVNALPALGALLVLFLPVPWREEGARPS